MKKILLTIAGVMAFSMGYSQYYYYKFASSKQNPNNLNNDAEYPDQNGLSAGWTKIDNGGAASARWTAEQTIPFTFNFNGMAVTKFKVSTSGVLTFDVAASNVPGYTGGILPSAGIPDNSVCLWGLSGIGSNDYIFTKTFGTAGSRQLWVHFNSYSYGSSVSDGSNFTYWSIVLEEGTDNIYLVDQRTGGYAAGVKILSAGVQVNGTMATMVLGSPSLVALAGTDATPADNVYYQFVQGIQPVNDLAGNTLGVSPYLPLTSAPFNMSLVVTNMGTATVTSAELSYTINGGTAVTGSVNGLNLAPGASTTLTHPVKWTPASSATYNVELWASLVNGVSDEKTANDRVSKSIQVIDQFVQRRALHEVFTSSTCPPCKPGNEAMHAIIDPKDASKYTVIKYQQDFPGLGDPYATQEALNRRAYYGINSIPRLELDGGWDANPSGYTNTLFDNAAVIPAFLEINATHTVHYKKVSIDVTLNPLVDFTGDNRLHVGILEAKTVLNVETNGETEFVHVMKKMVPNEGGTSIGTMTKGTPKTFNLSFDFKGVYRLPENAKNSSGTYIYINNAIEHSVEEFTDFEVIVFVQNQATKDILQSNYSTGTYLSVKENENSVIASTKVYPNPAGNSATLDVLFKESTNLKITVMDQLGKEVITMEEGTVEAGLHSFKLDTSKLAAGTYFVKVNTNDQITTEKIIIVK